MTHVTKVSGPPGTGKTSTIIKAIDHMLQSGIQPEEIAFVSLTNKSINEAVSRVRAQFGEDIANRCKNFKTLHAFTTINGGAQNGSIIDADGYSEMLDYMKSQGFMKNVDKLTWHTTGEDHPSRHWTLDANGFHKTTETSWIDGYVEFISSKGWDLNSDLTRYAQKVAQLAERWKMRTGSLEFEDVIQNFNQGGHDVCPTFHAIFVDEAQDLTPDQWTTIEALKSKTKNLLIFGDVNQSIYGFAGVDTNRYINFEATEEHALNTTHRFGDTINTLALKKLGKHNLEPHIEITTKTEKRSYYHNDLDGDQTIRLIRRAVDLGKSVLVLAKKKKHLPNKERMKEVYGDNVKISTVHKSKGGEADVVLYINKSEVSGWSAAEEARIDYVARTRARKILIERN